MEDTLVNSILSLYKERNWRSIVSEYHDHPERSKLLWVFPDEKNFEFLRDCVIENGCDSIISVGCGSGLLEWMIIEATGLPVTGIEVDHAWWQCKYAPPTFIPLILTSPTIDNATSCLLQNAKTSAMLFCYFNNSLAFADYMKHYSGHLLVIIGPGSGKGVHTDPSPFDDLGEEWNLYKSQEVRNSKDYIAFYKRLKKNENKYMNGF